MRTTTASHNNKVGGVTSTQDLWLVYSPVSNDRAFVDALCALYYLPEQYKLMVVDTGASHEMPAEHYDLMSRVQIAGKRAGLSDETTPFAFIRGEADKMSPGSGKKAPTVIVTDQPDQYIKDNEWDGFTVPTDKPEALASAILNIARTSLYYNGLQLVKQSFAR